MIFYIHISIQKNHFNLIVWELVSLLVKYFECIVCMCMGVWVREMYLVFVHIRVFFRKVELSTTSFYIWLFVLFAIGYNNVRRWIYGHINNIFLYKNICESSSNRIWDWTYASQQRVFFFYFIVQTVCYTTITTSSNACLYAIQHSQIRSNFVPRLQVY